jgi:hypothetical protein
MSEPHAFRRKRKEADFKWTMGKHLAAGLFHSHSSGWERSSDRSSSSESSLVLPFSSSFTILLVGEC